MSTKIYLFFVSLVILIGAVLIFTQYFLKPCGPEVGTGLHCSFEQGMKATVDGPAEVSISNFHEPFKVGYLVDGQMKVDAPPAINGYYYTSYVITDDVDFYMIESNGGISTPNIHITAIEGTGYPTLKVTRTWTDVFTQVLHWYMLPVWLLYLMYFGVFLYAGINS